MRFPRSKDRLLVCAALVLLVVFGYFRAGQLGFTEFDDPDYVSRNAHVQAGLTWSGVTWALTTGCSSNWHPLTWISHMVDCQTFGLDSGADHIVNVGFHALNAILLFLLLSSITGSMWRSAFVAALFAAHPLNVENVAWIAERKSLLSTVFWLLTMRAYFRYRAKPGVGRYALVVVLFALGLMAKPMLVTLPFVLLLMDYWPLGKAAEGKMDLRRAVVDKLPLVALSVASCWVTMLVQARGGAVRMLGELPIGERLANVPVAYVEYIGKMIWPSGLCVMYPHPKDTLPVWIIVACVAALVGVSWAAYRTRRSRPYMLVGWLWYLVTLAPVIGIVQVGSQAMADRYAYVPLIGVFVMIAWGARDLFAMMRLSRRWLAVPAAAIPVVLAVCTFSQTGYWRDNDTLWNRALAVTHDHPMVQCCYVSGLLAEDRSDEAISLLRSALSNPQCREVTHYLLGSVLAKQGRLSDAVAEYEASLRVDSDYAPAHNNLGVALARQGQSGQAVEHLCTAVRLMPNYADAHHNYGVLLAREGKIDEAIREWKRAIEIDPSRGNTRLKLAAALLQIGDAAGAREQVDAAEEAGFRPDPRMTELLKSRTRFSR